MFRFALVSLALALVAALVGLSGASASIATLGRVLFHALAVLAAVGVVVGVLGWPPVRAR